MRRRRKRILIVTNAVMVSLMIGVVGWVTVCSRDIPAPDVSDLAVEAADVPDENNAYVYFEKTVDSFDWPKDERRVSSILIDKRWDEAFVTDLLSRNATTLSLVKRGLACPTYQPHEGSRLEPPKLAYLWCHDIVQLLALEAMREKRAGRIDHVWQSCFDQCRLGSFMTARPRDPVEYMSGVMILGWGFEQVERLLRESHPQETELLALLNELNRISTLDAGMVRTIKEEFRLVAEAVDRPDSRTGHHVLLSRYVFQRNRTKQMCAEFLRSAVRIASQPYAQARVPEFKPLPSSEIGRRLLPLRRNGAGRILAAMVTSPDVIGRMVTAKCSTQSHLGGFRLVVACRLYEIRHGRLPETLDALVPECLAEVPRDPFDGNPFRYLPEKAVVYSIGKDLKDSSATPASLSTVYPSRGARSNGDDLVYAIDDKAE